MKRLCKHRVGSFCAEEQFDGMPSDEDCAQCNMYEGDDRGLGDKLQKSFHKLGVDRVVKKWTDKTGRSCGCGKRRAKLNKIFPSRA